MKADPLSTLDSLRNMFSALFTAWTVFMGNSMGRRTKADFLEEQVYARDLSLLEDPEIAHALWHWLIPQSLRMECTVQAKVDWMPSIFQLIRTCIGDDVERIIAVIQNHTTNIAFELREVARSCRSQEMVTFVALRRDMDLDEVVRRLAYLGMKPALLREGIATIPKFPADTEEAVVIMGDAKQYGVVRLWNTRKIRMDPIAKRFVLVKGKCVLAKRIAET